MSVFKYFAPPEWDNDVPKDAVGENLTKKHKLKKSKLKDEKPVDKKNTEANVGPAVQSKKNKMKKKLKPEKTGSKLNGEDNKINLLEQSKNQTKKRKSESYQLHSKKKKHDNKESYVKFESPKFNDSLVNNTNETVPVTPLSKNSRKKQQRKLNNSLLNKSNSIEIIDKNTKIPINKSISSETTLKTLKNRKRRAKKNKNKGSQNSINEDSVNKISLLNEENKVPNSKITRENTSEVEKKVRLPSTSKNEIVVEKGVQSPKGKKNKTLLPSLKNMKLKNDNHIDRKSLKKKMKLKDILKSTLTLNQNDKSSDSLNMKSDNSEILAAMNNEIENNKPEQPKSLRERMMERLKSARFRYLNEQIYKRESNEAIRLFKEEPDAFQAYHEGYRQQVNKWPLNPLDIIIGDISKLSKNLTIADLGCGDARLSKSVSQTVHSFDLVSLNPNVTACDMAHTPLLTGQIDIAVYCLSLMGINLKDYVIEANRILKVGGLLKIAEVESRFENVDQFTSDIQKYGFSLIKKDLNNDLFYFMDFKKESDIKKRNKLPQLKLNPCYYKKR